MFITQHYLMHFKDLIKVFLCNSLALCMHQQHIFLIVPPLTDFLIICLLSLPPETHQRSDYEGEHEDREPSCQHEEEPCASDHSM